MSARRHALLLGVLVTACRPAADDADLLPPPGYVEPPLPPKRASSSAPPRYQSGFYAIESGTDGTTWRWMGKNAKVGLPRVRGPGRLRIAGWAPVELLRDEPTLTVSLAGRVLASERVPKGHVVREWTIAAEAFGDGVLDLTMSDTATPPGDPRSLGFALEAVTWEPAGTSTDLPK